MRELHVVALSEDGASVVLATRPGGTKGGYTVRLDGLLTAAVRGELRRPGEPEQPEVVLTPKEIQSRLRAGETPRQIAELAGVPVSRVERFEGPVISERARVVEMTRAAHMVRGRKGRSALPLGVVVDRELAAMAGFDEESVDWSAKRRDEGPWEVSLAWTARGRSRTAHWLYDPVGREVTALDPASAALGHVESASAPAPRPAAPKPATKTAKKAAAPKPAVKPVAPKAAKKPAAPKPSANKAAAPEPAAPKAAKKAAAPKPSANKAAAPKPAARKAAKKAAAPTPVAKKAGAPKPTARKAAAPKPAAKAGARAAAGPKRPARPAPVQEPAPPRRVLRIVGDDDVVPVPRRAAAGRASVPAWADVLLGATPSTPRDGDEG